MTARIPGEEGEIRQVELVGEMRHAAGMLVAAMEQDDRAARRSGTRRPMAVEEVDAVMGAERLLLDRRASNSEAPSGDKRVPRNPFGNFAEPGADPVCDGENEQETASIGISQPSQAGSGPPRRRATAPSAPKTTARSLLPIGPS